MTLVAALRFAIMVVIAGVMGCASDSIVTEAPTDVNTIAVTPGFASLSVGQTMQAGAIVRSASGTELAGVAVSWASSNIAIATVTQAGLITAVAPGTASITASANGKSGFASITVAAIRVATVAVVLSAPAAIVGQPVTATATTRDASGGVLAGRVIAWQSSNSNVASISATGAITTVAAGTTNIIATSEGITGSASLTVAPSVASVTVSLPAATLTVGKSVTATAVLRDANNAVISGGTVTWLSSNTNIATVSSAGLVSAVAPGQASIIATNDGLPPSGTSATSVNGLATTVSGSALLTVQVAAASVAVTLGTPSLRVGQTTMATGVVKDASNNVLTRTITWTSTNTSVATVDATAKVTAIAAGTASVVGAVDDVSGSAAATVTAGAPGAAARLGIVTQPDGAVSGQTFTTPAVVAIRDTAGLVVTTAGTTVTATVASGNGTITAGGQAIASNGLATFSALRITGTGPHTLTFTASGLTAATSNAFTIAAPPLVTTVASSAVTGTVNAALAAATPVTASGGTPPYTFALSGGTLPSGLTFNTTSGQLSGTPTATLALTTFTVTVIDAASATSAKAFQLTVNGGSTANECASPKAGWIFCDDFETDRTASYFEYDNAGGKFVRAPSTGYGGSVGMRATYTTGQTSAGSLHLAFGRTPSAYFRAADAGTANYRELYWRFYVYRQPGWVGNGPGKMTRATIFAKSDFSQAMIAHGWTSDSDDRFFMLDPASGTDVNGTLVTVGYNDFANLRWLGAAPSAQPEEDQPHVGQWACYEFHAKLNDAGQSNGIFELTINGQLSARKTGLNWVGSYNAYGINAVYLEQYQNAGAPAANVRVFDNFVVSTQPIGCLP